MLAVSGSGLQALFLHCNFGASIVKDDTPSLNRLFKQLGLPDSDEDIDKFITCHSPLSETTPLQHASFWNKAQKTFLEEALCEDSVWSLLVDDLSERLRN